MTLTKYSASGSMRRTTWPRLVFLFYELVTNSRTFFVLFSELFLQLSGVWSHLSYHSSYIEFFISSQVFEAIKVIIQVILNFLFLHRCLRPSKLSSPSWGKTSSPSRSSSSRATSCPCSAKHTGTLRQSTRQRWGIVLILRQLILITALCYLLISAACCCY